MSLRVVGLGGTCPTREHGADQSNAVKGRQPEDSLTALLTPDDAAALLRSFLQGESARVAGLSP
jgi:hypothetical protein